MFKDYKKGRNEFLLSFKTQPTHEDVIYYIYIMRKKYENK
jgi:hypothetical protein